MSRILNIAFRVDESIQIGSGHFMRCLTLADVLAGRGAMIRFVCRFLPEHSRRMLHERSYEFIKLSAGKIDVNTDELAHAHWLGGSQRHDAKVTIEALSDRLWDWLIVDHYGLDARWEADLRNSTKHILVIDDLADRLHNCDILMDDNLLPSIETRYIDKVPRSCRLLLGPKYVPLRKEFLQLRENSKFRSGCVNRILVTFGGIDAANYTSWTIEALADLKTRGLAIDVILGEKNQRNKHIQNVCDNYGFNCYIQTNQMGNLMKEADLAIGAAGFTSYEFVAMKLPAILMPVSEIQTIFALEMEGKGVAYVPRVSRGATSEALLAEFLKVIDSLAMRTSMSRACVEVVDGKGVERVVEELVGHKE